MSLTKTEEDLVVWGGACLILVLIAIISYFSYRMLLPKKMAKAIEKAENKKNNKNIIRKNTIVENIRSLSKSSIPITPEKPNNVESDKKTSGESTGANESNAVVNGTSGGGALQKTDSCPVSPIHPSKEEEEKKDDVE